jgi:hypothetical protein
MNIPEKRLEFEKFLADLSARLVALPPERVDDEIRSALETVPRVGPCGKGDVVQNFQNMLMSFSEYGNESLCHGKRD